MADYVTVCKASDLDPGEMIRVSVDDFPICLYNIDGEYYATQDTCTHEEASLCEGELFDDAVMCPLHGAEFNVRTGAVLSLPAVVPLRTFPVKVEDGEVKILAEL